ncbi:MAG: DUF1343 domain-containing protein [Myxococcales bacterium]|nr:DUF1343 domain-containing protein [Myxococcales bacterium]
MERVEIGLERLASDRIDLIRGRRIGLVVNHSSYTPEMVHAVDWLRGCGADVAVLFGPEHGLWGTHQDMEAVGSHAGYAWGLPLYSLYGHGAETLSPPPAALTGLDALVFDIQDIGARYYTFIYTLRYCMIACAEAGIPLVVCDRPNPLNGRDIEGNLVQPGFFSFVGDVPLCNRHGLTVGELARHFNESIDLELEVVACRGYRRSQAYDETGLAFVPTSPNMPTLETAWVYPGMCLLEGTNLSEGRGTTTPFLLFGAPYVEPFALRAALLEDPDASSALAGLVLRPCYFRPMFQKWAGALCGGLSLHLRERDAVRSFAFALHLIATLRRLYPDDFDWRREPYEFVSDRLAIDLLCGTDAVRLAIEAGRRTPEILATMVDDQQRFDAIRRAVALYPE